MQQGFIKLFRSLLEWGYIGNPKMLQLWIVLLLLASHNEKNWQDIEIAPGQIVTSVRKICLITLQSEKTTRNCLEKLKKGKQIDIQTTNRYTLITICNWENYQGYGDTVKGEQRANKGQTKGKQRATNKNDKNKKNYKNKEKEINKEKESPQNSFSVPDEISLAWNGYADMRKSIKKPMTERAMTMALNRLKELAGDNTELQCKILDQSTMNCWTGLFPIKEEREQKAVAFNVDLAEQQSPKDFGIMKNRRRRND